jgi:type II secretory pathway pseudopilin PulG
MAQTTAVGSVRRLTLHEQQRGFGYLTILVLLVGMSIALGVASERVDTTIKRDKEKDLIFIGQQYQQALTNYYNQTPNALPLKLAELLADKRSLKTKHHLRQLFLDPMTNQPWGIERNTQNQITAVYSLSDQVFLMNPTLIATKLGEKSVIIKKHSDLKFKFKATQNNQTSQSAAPLNP